MEQSKIEAEFQAEVLELEKKYAKRYAPLYQQRASIINGKEEPSDQLVEEGRKSQEEDDSDDEGAESELAPKPSASDIEAAPKVCLPSLSIYLKVSSNWSLRASPSFGLLL